ncbi:MAG: hypothetical protein ACFFDH_04780 [Promethearchaeota archaeon]
MSSKISDFDIVEWGYYFPISNAQNIKRNFGMISYFVDIETEKKTYKMTIKISPLRFRGEDKTEAREKAQKLLDQIEQVLLQNQ